MPSLGQKCLAFFLNTFEKHVAVRGTAKRSCRPCVFRNCGQCHRAHDERVEPTVEGVSGGGNGDRLDYWNNKREATDSLRDGISEYRKLAHKILQGYEAEDLSNALPGEQQTIRDRYDGEREKIRDGVPEPDAYYVNQALTGVADALLARIHGDCRTLRARVGTAHASE